jgi:two-component system response regulator YesN
MESLDELLNDEPRPLGKAERSYRLIKEYIGHNYHLPINLSTICDELNFHSSYVSMMFKGFSGLTISAYLERCRMNAAKEILSYNEAPIANIAIKCEYSSEAYFIKVFKNISEQRLENIEKVRKVN